MKITPNYRIYLINPIENIEINSIFLFKNLRTLLEQNITKQTAGDDILIDYKNFVKVGSMVGPKCK